MSRFWKANLSKDYANRDYKSVLSEFSGDEIKRMLERISHIHIKENGEEIERLISVSEKNLLCSIMYSTILSIKFCDITTYAAISAGEYTADCLFKDILNTDLQGYLSYFIPMWEFLDFLAFKGKEFEIVDGVLLQYHGNEKNVVIPVGVTEIGKEAFEFNDWIYSVSIPDSVLVIDKGAFRACHNLKNISIPDSVTSIGRGAFENCTSLESVFIPDSVTEIGDWAFEGCSSLESVSIPDSVTEIGDWAFEGCPFQP